MQQVERWIAFILPLGRIIGWRQVDRKLAFLTSERRTDEATLHNRPVGWQAHLICNCWRSMQPGIRRKKEQIAGAASKYQQHNSQYQSHPRANNLEERLWLPNCSGCCCYRCVPKSLPGEARQLIGWVEQYFSESG